MALKIPQDHLVFALKPIIQEISASFLSTNQLNYFQYLRCYDDGSIGLLTNHTGLMEHFQHIDSEPVVFSSFDNQHLNASSYWFLWDEELPDMPVQLAREKFNLRNGLTLVRRAKHYYDMIAVASAFEPSNGGAFYLNKIKAIENFVNTFDENNKELIQLMDENPIQLPSSYRDVNYDKLCLSEGKISVCGRFGTTYITTQELACLRCLLLGFSYKVTAQRLNISARTVETYMQRIKLRTGFSTLTEMGSLV